MCRNGGRGRIIEHRSNGAGLYRSVLGEVFVVEVVQVVELELGCVVRLVLWCANCRRYFLCRFSLMFVEMNGLSAGECLFGMVIFADFFVLLERYFLGKMVGTDVMMEILVEVAVVETVHVVRGTFFVFLGVVAWEI